MCSGSAAWLQASGAGGAAAGSEPCGAHAVSETPPSPLVCISSSPDAVASGIRCSTVESPNDKLTTSCWNRIVKGFFIRPHPPCRPDPPAAQNPSSHKNDPPQGDTLPRLLSPTTWATSSTPDQSRTVSSCPAIPITLPRKCSENTRPSLDSKSTKNSHGSGLVMQ